MKRTTQDDLERRSSESGVPIEIDTEENVGYLKVGRTTYYATLAETAVPR